MNPISISNMSEIISPQLNHALLRLDLNLSTEDIESNVPNLMSDSLQKTLLFGGKRIRPLLTFLIGEILSLPLPLLEPYARAIEQVHIASLCHDDVIDNSVSRRGIPSINAICSNKKAILTGDYLLGEVIADMCKIAPTPILQELSMVIKGLAQGEWLQSEILDYKGGADSTVPARELITSIIQLKTANMIRWCCIVPAMLSNFPEAEIDKLRAFGTSVGILFQLTDDIIDINLHKNKSKYHAGTSIDTNSDWNIKSGSINSVLFELFNNNPQYWPLWKDGSILHLSGKQSQLSLKLMDYLQKAIFNVQEQVLFHASKALQNLESVFQFIADQSTIDPNLNTSGTGSFQTAIEAFNTLKNLVKYLPLRNN